MHCPVCTTRYDQAGHLPLLMPCGKSVCEVCVQSSLRRSDCSFWCPFCSSYHQQPPRKQFPLNEALIYLVKTDRADEHSEEVMATNPKLNEALDEMATNSIDLDKALYKSAKNLKTTFEQLENEINEKSNLMIEKIRAARNELIKELNK